MKFFIYLFGLMFTVKGDPIGSVEIFPGNNDTLGPTRRILRGREVGDTRPYMVYLRAAANADAKILDTNWLCGGVIIHERYILTSAACIEDAKHFYVVSGTHKWYPSHEKSNECIIHGAKKAVWKCVPKSYFFDGEDFDNIRWMVGDIAVVKVEDNFNFERRVRGCDFIPKKVDFNNRTTDLERSGTVGSIAGWGTNSIFGDGSLSHQQQFRTTVNTPNLMETDVVLISKRNCKKRWEPRYHFIIDEHMICTKDETDAEAMSMVCSEREVNCKELIYTDDETKSEEDEQPARRQIIDPTELHVHNPVHTDHARRTKVLAGGFCENDHGGPLIVGQGKSSVVVGVMSACLTKDVLRKCYGPFLYTSIYRYRNLITCAIDKDIGPTCRRLLRSSKTPVAETVFDWSFHTDGPAKTEHPAHHVRSNDMDSTARSPPLLTTFIKPVAFKQAASDDAIIT